MQWPASPRVLSLGNGLEGASGARGLALRALQGSGEVTQLETDGSKSRAQQFDGSLLVPRPQSFPAVFLSLFFPVRVRFLPLLIDFLLENIPVVIFASEFGRGYGGRSGRAWGRACGLLTVGTTCQRLPRLPTGAQRRREELWRRVPD